MFEYFISEASKVNFNIRPSPTPCPSSCLHVSYLAGTSSMFSDTMNDEPECATVVRQL